MTERDDTSKSLCPVCESAVKKGSRSFPFCSKRCKMIDLGRWMNESYRISRQLWPVDEDGLHREEPPPPGALRE